MDDVANVDTGSGVKVTAAAVAAAEELAQLVREATAGLPFEAEPATFMVALERLAAAESEAA